MELGGLGNVAYVLLFAGIALGMGAGVMSNIRIASTAGATYTGTSYPISAEQVALVNGTNVTVANLGNGLASLDLYNRDRTVHYTEGLNYTLDPRTGNVGLFNILE